MVRHCSPETGRFRGHVGGQAHTLKKVAPTMPLSDVKIRTAKPGAKPMKLGDSGGLLLLVQPSGGKLWRFKYRINGKEKKLSFGKYPDVSLQAARKRRDEARSAVAAGVDTAEEKKREALEIALPVSTRTSVRRSAASVIPSSSASALLIALSVNAMRAASRKATAPRPSSAVTSRLPKVLYSEALYGLYLEDYIIELEVFIDQRAAEVTETEERRHGKHGRTLRL